MTPNKEDELHSMIQSLQSMEYEQPLHPRGISRHSSFSHDDQSHISYTGTLKSLPWYSSTLQRTPDLDEKLFGDLFSRYEKPSFSSMQTFRKRLPAYGTREVILKAVEESQVVVVTGETGCGKTTQVPQYILDSFIESKKGSLCKIVCTQPRRISAISVAERVAQERCVPCGNKSDVGYHIRLEYKIPRDEGSILFCTTGIILQQLQSSPYLENISHIIVDEVHERDLLSDFLLIALKNILSKRDDLKVILMSATLNAEEFSEYFGSCPVVEIPGFTFPVDVFTLEDIIELTKYKPQKTDKQCRQPVWKKFTRKGEEAIVDRIFEEEEKREYFESLHTKYSYSTIKALKDFDEDKIDLELIVELLRNISCAEKEGAVLVFVPGWQQINTLHRMLTDNVFFSSDRFLIIPLHSMMPTIHQKEVFDKPPSGIRKVILATNIAETSITIDDIVFVIDSGKIKMKSLDSETNIQLLQPEWVAHSNMKQRRGRAGRTQAGVCYHMLTKYRASRLDAYQLPEMLRSSLEELILKIKILELGKVEPFLEKALNPPNPRIVQSSIKTLEKLNALTVQEELTPLGYHLARLPLDPHSGKMILLGAIFSCLDPILSVAASLSFKDAFVIPLGKEHLVNQRKKELAGDSQSDHLMFARVIELWEQAARQRNGYKFCKENFLALSTLRMLANLKIQYVEYLKDLGFHHGGDPKADEYNRNSHNTVLIRAIICAGLYPHVAKVVKEMNIGRGAAKKFPSLLKARTEDGLKVSVHPKSVNALADDISTGWLVYHLKIKSTQIYLHDTTAVTAFSLLFFGGKLETGTLHRRLKAISIDKWIVLQCSRRNADLVLDLRKELDRLLKHKIVNPGPSNWDASSKEARVLNSIIELLTSEETLTVADFE